MDKYEEIPNKPTFKRKLNKLKLKHKIISPAIALIEGTLEIITIDRYILITYITLKESWFDSYYWGSLTLHSRINFMLK